MLPATRSRASLKPERAAQELLRRRRARTSLIEYGRSIDIPGTPAHDPYAGIPDNELPEEAWRDERDVVFAPIESVVVKHHRVMLDAMQQTIETWGGRLIIQAPPGSAKSTYASVVASTWAMGKFPGFGVLLGSYATPIARKHSRRAQQITRQADYSTIWPERPTLQRGVQAAHEWALSNGSEYLAGGILAGLAGFRADLVVADDLIANREDAESAVIREKTMDEFRDGLESRLKPGGSIILINTRWHHEDPCGQLLPVDYDGGSGYVIGQDGREWLVLNMPARAERADDPVGREVGEYLWPEWFPRKHWQAFENDPRARRRWASLYQQRPTADEGEDFKREWFHFYEPDELPEHLTYYAASDFAVTEVEPEDQRQGRIDWTEHGVVGIDEDGDLWFVAWWSGQKETDVSIDAMIDLAVEWRPRRWWDEGGTIDKAIRSAIRKRQRERAVYGKHGSAKKPRPERGTFFRLEAIPRIADKRAKCQAFQARASARTCHLPRWQSWAHEVVGQLTGFPGHRYDDKYDVCGLFGRGIDQMTDAVEPVHERRPVLRPFTGKWLEYYDQDTKPKRRER